MKNILVPTDFSACATHAVDAAFQFAERFSSKVHLLHVIRSARNSQIDPPEEQAQQRNNALALLEKITEGYNYGDYTFQVEEGSLNQVIAGYCQQHTIDLVIMGSHGAGGKNEYFIGSNTQKVVRSIHVPVLVIKEKLEDLNFDKVVFASNFNSNEEASFLRFKNFVKHFIPEIHLVMVHTSSLFDPPYVLSQEAMEDFKALCEPFKCEIHIFRDFTIEKGIRAFANTIGAKLVGISNHNRSPLKRMFIGSNVEALVNHANLPILSIDFQEP